MNGIQPPHDIKELLPAEPSLWPWILLFIFLILLIVAIVLLIKNWQKRPQKPPKPIDGRETLRLSLSQLEDEIFARELFSEAEKKELYRRLWDLFRELCGYRLQIQALPMTRVELIRNLEQKAPFSPERLAALVRFFGRAEAALFSDARIDEQVLRDDLRLVKTVFERWLGEENGEAK